MKRTDINTVLFHLICVLPVVFSLHLTGTWTPKSQFFHFLSKFGFQKADKHHAEDTQGYIYGNITSKDTNIQQQTVLVLVDSEYFMEYYGNTTLLPRSKACYAMFDKIRTSRVAFDRECNPTGAQDFMRQIPCASGELCVDEDNAQNVIPGYQFTYHVRDRSQPRYWYLSFVACLQDPMAAGSCNWTESAADINIDYDIWLVNGNPSSKLVNPFEHQFSFEMQDVFEIYLIFFVLYIILIPVWIYAYLQQRHYITQLLTLCMLLEFLGIIANLIHIVIFAFNGKGVYVISVMGNGLASLAECFLMLLLLLMAKGWTITRMDITSRGLLAAIWGLYTVLNIVLFVFNLVEVDIISNIDIYETWPGYLTLAFRLLIMCWFLYELRKTAIQEHDFNKLQFLQHFGAFFLVWFVYLPIVALISTQIVSALWKFKTALSITYSADLLSYAVLIHLLWPSRSVLLLIKREQSLPTYELEATGLLDTDSAFTGTDDSGQDREQNRKPVPQNGVLLHAHTGHDMTNTAKGRDNLVDISDDEISL